MKRSLLSGIAAAVMISGAAFAQSTTSTTTTWSDEYGNIIREEVTTRKFEPIVDPKMTVTIGASLPQTVTTLHPLPSTIRVEKPERYAYVVVNDDPVIVERESRRIVHVYKDDD
jgi:hypothetical protein